VTPPDPGLAGDAPRVTSPFAEAVEAVEELPAAGRSGLRRRVYLLMAIGIAFPLSLMAGVGWYWLDALGQRLVKGRVIGATTVAAHFDQEVNGDLELLQRLAARVGPHLGQPGAVEPGRAVEEALDQFRRRETIYLIDASRQVVAEAPRGGRAVLRPDPALIEAVWRSGRPTVSGLHVVGTSHVVHELVPIHDYSGAVVGVAGGTFDPTRREFDHMLSLLRRGATGEADLVDAEDRVMASTVAGRIGALSGCRDTLDRLRQERRSDSLRQPGGCPDPGQPAGELELLTFVPLGAAPWAVVIHQVSLEVLPTEGTAIWIALLAVLAIQFTLTGIFAWGAANSVTRPVAVLTHEAERIALGRLDMPIPPLGDDEVGQLGVSLDRMRQAIKELIEREERTNQELEVRVAERTRSLDEANVKLRQREVARGELLHKVITAQEDERKRVARELHDETTQALAVLLMRIERAAEAIRAGRDPGLEEVKVLATWALDDVHRMILDLRPSVLDDLGLLSAIRWYAERTLREKGIAVRCEFGELARLPPELETALFRLCQEAMSNVARHAEASQVLVEVSREGREIRVAIEDDGKGFDPAATTIKGGRPHWGLIGIRERAELLGGEARIDSSPGAGTRVNVRIPLPEEVE